MGLSAERNLRIADIRKLIYPLWLASFFFAASCQTAPNPPILRAEVPGRPFGVVEDLAWDSDSDVQAIVSSMVDAGVQTLRMDFRWYMLEPSKGRFVFTVHDPIVSALNAHGIEILGIFDDVPTWANGHSGAWSGTYPPTKDSDWADYIANVAAHYRGKVQYWELWNEENISQFFRPVPDAARYVRLLRAGYSAAKSADPGAQVVLGGLAGNGVNMKWEPLESQNFLQKIYDKGGKGYFDVVAIHPYVHPVLVGFARLRGFVNDTRKVMIENEGGDKPIWLSEIGWSTAPNAWSQQTITERDAANWVQILYERYADLGVPKIFWYNFRDSGTVAGNVEHHFGLTRRDLTPKPAYVWYRDVARLVAPDN
jgi:hypothetical protein